MISRLQRIGPFGGDIQTPAIDKLAGEGMLFSNFHVLPTCSDTFSFAYRV